MTNKLSISLIISVITSCLLLAWFTLIVARHIGINADAIYTYSFAKDIVTGTPLSTWTFPGQLFVFPDVIVSLPVVAFFHDPVIALSVMSGIQIVAIILLVSFVQKNRMTFSFLERFVAVTYITVITYFIGRQFFHGDWTTIADKTAVLDHHMFGAVVALGLHLFTSPDSIKRNFAVKNFVLALIFFATSFSDPFFFIYFFSFAFARVCLLNKAALHYRLWLVSMALFFLTGIAGIALNHFTNPDLLLQVQNSKAALDRWKFFDVVGWKGLLMLFALPLLLGLGQTRDKQRTASSTAIGVVLIVAGIASTGLIVEKYHLRYVGVYFPAIIYLVANRLPQSFYSAAVKPVVSLIMLVVMMIYAPTTFSGVRAALFTDASRILDCEAFQLYSNNATVVSDIGSAKILFELSGRQFNLIQTGDLVSPYQWMYNASWATKSLQKSDNVLFIRDHLPAGKLDEIAALPLAQSLCDGKVILAKQSPNLAIIAPILSARG